MTQRTPKPVSQANYVTVRGFKMLTDELAELRTVERPQVVVEVADAAAQGDRSENAEYIYGKKRLREIDKRVRWLIKRLESSVVVDPREQSGETIFFGATVLVEEGDEEKELQIVGVDESEPGAGRISYKSPIGAALVGKSIDDEVQVRTPSGVRSLYVLDVSYN